MADNFKNGLLCCILPWFYLSPFYQKLRKIFLWYLLWEPGQVPRSKFLKHSWGFLLLTPPGIFNSHNTPREHPSICHLKYSFSYCGSSFCSEFCWSVSALVSSSFLCLPVFLSSYGQQWFALCPHITFWIQEKLFIFSLFSFFY